MSEFLKFGSGVDWSEFENFTQVGVSTSINTGSQIVLMDIVGEGYIDLCLLTGGRVSNNSYKVKITIEVDDIICEFFKIGDSNVVISSGKYLRSHYGSFLSYFIPRIRNSSTSNGMLSGLEANFNTPAIKLMSNLNTFNSPDESSLNQYSYFLITPNGLFFKNKFKVTIQNIDSVPCGICSFIMGGVKE